MRRTNIILLVPVLISLTVSNASYCAEKKQGTDKVTRQMDRVAVRLHHMEKQLDKMYGPIDKLSDPVERLEKPVSGVNNQLDKLKTDLNELKKTVNITSTLILCAILGVGLFVAVCIPIGVVIAWRYRNKILNKVDQLTPPNPNGSDSDQLPPHTPVGPVISSR